jgi:hypothetical protein
MATTKEAAEVKGTTWLAEHVNEVTGSEYDGFGIRVLLRKLAKDGVIERGEGRYSFSGPKDKTVLAVVKFVKSGEAASAKSERLDELKAKRAAAANKGPAAKKAPAAKKTSSSRRRRAAAPVEEEDDEDEVDLDEI